MHTLAGRSNASVGECSNICAARRPLAETASGQPITRNDACVLDKALTVDVYYSVLLEVPRGTCTHDARASSG